MIIGKNPSNEFTMLLSTLIDLRYELTRKETTKGEEILQAVEHKLLLMVNDIELPIDKTDN